MRDGEGLPEFHALLEESPLVDLVEADVDACHGEAHVINANYIMMEAFFSSIEESLSDSDVYRAILRAEQERGIYWPETNPPLPRAAA
jgi:hypothetical protein